MKCLITNKSTVYNEATQRYYSHRSDSQPKVKHLLIAFSALQQNFCYDRQKGLLLFPTLNRCDWLEGQKEAFVIKKKKRRGIYPAL